jgi:hypothetical protein
MKIDKELAELAILSGELLALASQSLIVTGHLIPMGLAFSVSFWSGGKKELIRFLDGDGRAMPEFAESWFSQNHKKSKFIGIAIDAHGFFEGQKRDTIALRSRNSCGNRQLLIFLPYTPATDTDPLSFESPILDSPGGMRFSPHAHAELLDAIFRGRDLCPDAIRRMAAWKKS